MDAKDDGLAAGAQRLNALLGWWGIPIIGDDGAIDGQIKRFQQFASDLQRACSGAHSNHMDALDDGNVRLASLYMKLLRSQGPHELMATELEILTTFIDCASRRAKGWAHLTEKLQECCSAIAREAAGDLRREVSKTAPNERSGVQQPRIN